MEFVGILLLFAPLGVLIFLLRRSSGSPPLMQFFNLGAADPVAPAAAPAEAVQVELTPEPQAAPAEIKIVPTVVVPKQMLS